VAVLCAALLHAQALQVLDLTGCQASDKGVAWLAVWMRRTQKLRRLVLADNGIGPVGCVKLAEGVSGCCSLSELQVSGNPIQSCADLAAAASRVMLKTLDMGHCGLGPESAEHFANNSLAELGFRGNPIETLGLAALGRMLMGNSTLRKLNVRQCCAPRKKAATAHWSELAKGIKLNMSLRELDLRDNALSKQVVVCHLLILGTHNPQTLEELTLAASVSTTHCQILLDGAVVLNDQEVSQQTALSSFAPRLNLFSIIELDATWRSSRKRAIQMRWLHCLGTVLFPSLAAVR
jgi:Ran GTPase-activating protein (RanGAP) involved in mRNA processing and transport